MWHLQEGYEDTIGRALEESHEGNYMYQLVSSLKKVKSDLKGWYKRVPKRNSIDLRSKLNDVHNVLASDPMDVSAVTLEGEFSVDPKLISGRT